MEKREHELDQIGRGKAGCTHDVYVDNSVADVSDATSDLGLAGEASYLTHSNDLL